MHSFTFWQQLVSPHMAGLARALVASGDHVTIVATETMSSDRAKQGWSAPSVTGLRLEIVGGGDAVALAATFPSSTIHLTQGLRRNGYVAVANKALRLQGARWGTMMETVDDRGLVGRLKRVDYRLALSTARPDFVLAIGQEMPRWLAARGFPGDKTFPFAYFLEDPPVIRQSDWKRGKFRVGFVGQLIDRKGVDLLIEAMSGLNPSDVQLDVIGEGPEQARLKALADKRLRQACVRWLGSMPMARAREAIASLDCLVLPSRHDGWGAVVSEALVSGVPAICSDACGSAVAVVASKQGGVFPAGDVAALRSMLAKVVADGPIDLPRRRALANWGKCLTGEAGANYLRAIIASVYLDGLRPQVPWEVLPAISQPSLEQGT